MTEEIVAKIDKFINSSWTRASGDALVKNIIEDPIDGCDIVELSNEINNILQNKYPTSETQEWNLLKLMDSIVHTIGKKITLNLKQCRTDVFYAREDIAKARNIFYNAYQTEQTLLYARSELLATCSLSDKKMAKYHSKHLSDVYIDQKTLHNDKIFGYYISELFDKKLEHIFDERINLLKTMDKQLFIVDKNYQNRIETQIKDINDRLYKEFKKEATESEIGNDHIEL